MAIIYGIKATIKENAKGKVTGNLSSKREDIGFFKAEKGCIDCDYNCEQAIEKLVYTAQKFFKKYPTLRDEKKNLEDDFLGILVYLSTQEDLFKKHSSIIGAIGICQTRKISFTIPKGLEASFKKLHPDYWVYNEPNMVIE